MTAGLYRECVTESEAESTKQTVPSQFECNTNPPLNRQQWQVLPVFGTEEALVEPMLLALDTTVPFLAVSAKKPIEQDSKIFY